MEDTAAICYGSQQDIDSFKLSLQSVDPLQFDWVFTESRDAMAFLDLDIRRDDRFLQTGFLTTGTYIKPFHAPQYLHALSEHPRHCKLKIYDGQIYRFLLNNSTVEGFEQDVARLRSALLVRGYPAEFLGNAHWDSDVRRAHLLKLARRDFSIPGVARKQDVLVCKIPFFGDCRRLGIPAILNQCIGAVSTCLSEQQKDYLLRHRVIAAHMNSPSLFLKLYRHNFVSG